MMFSQGVARLHAAGTLRHADGTISTSARDTSCRPSSKVRIGPIALVPDARLGTPALAESMQLYLAVGAFRALSAHATSVTFAVTARRPYSAGVSPEGLT